MSLLTEDQLNDIVDMLLDDYGTRLTGGEISEITDFILENISGFETVDSNTLIQVINEIGNLHDFRYDVRAPTKREFRNRVIYIGNNLSKDSTLDW